MATSPTQLSLKKLREEGYIVAVVEHWNSFARIRQDLFGFIDLLALKGKEVFEDNWDKIFKKEGINLTEEELANVLIIEDIVTHHHKKKRSDDVSPHLQEYELNSSTGELRKVDNGD